MSKRVQIDRQFRTAWIMHESGKRSHIVSLVFDKKFGSRQFVSPGSGRKHVMMKGLRIL